jgi:hypothetical protein
MMVEAGSATNIGEMLLREGLITQNQLTAAIRTQRETEKPLGRILVEMGLISENVKMDFLRRRTGLPFVELAEEDIEPHVLKLLPHTLAEKHNIVPVRLERDGLLVAMEDPCDLILIDQLEELVLIKILPAIASISEIENALDYYEEEEEDLVLPLHLRLPFWYRFCRYWFLPLTVFGPFLLAVFFVLIATYTPYLENPFTELIWQLNADPFTTFLYVFLGWGLWAVVFYEINGLLFEDKKEAAEAATEEEPEL